MTRKCKVESDAPKEAAHRSRMTTEKMRQKKMRRPLRAVGVGIVLRWVSFASCGWGEQARFSQRSDHQHGCLASDSIFRVPGITNSRRNKMLLFSSVFNSKCLVDHMDRICKYNRVVPGTFRESPGCP